MMTKNVTNVDGVLPVLQSLGHDQGVNISPVLSVLIVLQSSDEKFNIVKFE